MNDVHDQQVIDQILAPDINFNKRYMSSLDDVERLASILRERRYAIVLASGSFDLIHLGHVKYLAQAKKLGDILIVGVDSDTKIKQRKGEDRPMVPEQERLELLAHQRPVDLIYLKSDTDPKWALIKAASPDTLVLTADHSYSDKELKALSEYCGRIEVLPRLAGVTTSERIRQMYMHLGDKLGPILADRLPELIDSVIKRR